MPIIKLHPCAYCKVRYALWEMTLVARLGDGNDGVYICKPCAS